MASLIPWRRSEPSELMLIYRTIWDHFEVVTYYHRHVDLFLTIVRCNEQREILAIYGTRHHRIMHDHQNEGLALVFIIMGMLREEQDDW